MKNTLFLILFILILILIQLPFLSVVLPLIIVPNLIIALSFSFALYEKEELAYRAGLIGGVLFDLLTFNIVGETSLIITVCLFLFSLYRRYVSKSLVSGFLGVLFANSVYLWFAEYGSSLNLRFYLVNGLVVFVLALVFRQVLNWLTFSFKSNFYSAKHK